MVGAGPAGAAAALSALRVRPGARVLLLDRADFPRDKACGDGVAPHALDVLADLGLPGLVDDHRPVARLHLGVDGGARTEGLMRRPARVVPRAVLDARIRAGALAAGAVAGRRVVRTVQVHHDEVVLDADRDPLRARVVVGADGAGSVLRRALGLGAAPSRPRGAWRCVATPPSAPTWRTSSGSCSPTTTGRPTRGRSRSGTAGPTSATGSCCSRTAR